MDYSKVKTDYLDEAAEWRKYRDAGGALDWVDFYPLRDKWREAGGTWHGPNVEHGTMPMDALLAFLERIAQLEYIAGNPDKTTSVALRLYWATQRGRSEEMDAVALRMREAGHTFRAIGQALNISGSAASRRYKHGKARAVAREGGK